MLLRSHSMRFMDFDALCPAGIGGTCPLKVAYQHIVGVLNFNTVREEAREVPAPSEVNMLEARVIHTLSIYTRDIVSKQLQPGAVGRPQIEVPSVRSGKWAGHYGQMDIVKNDFTER